MIEELPPVRVGIIGAGPWAHMFYAPILAAGPETVFAGAWARRPEAAAELVARHPGAGAFPSPEALFEAVDAVVISVAPDAQPGFAIRAAEAGRALVLEKPLAIELGAAEDLAAALTALNAPAMLMLTNRFNTVMRARLAEARAFGAFAARGGFISGAFLPSSAFATPWRLEQGGLLDVGPHVIDLAWEALGPIATTHASGDLHRAVAITLEHESSAQTQLLISTVAGLREQIAGIDLFGPGGLLSLNTAEGRETTAPTIRKELAEMVRTRQSHPVGVERGLALQRVIADLESQLRR
jgi:predicted dehydrogenase